MRVESVLPGFVLGHSVERVLMCSAMVEFRAVGLDHETIFIPKGIIQRMKNNGVF